MGEEECDRRLEEIGDAARRLRRSADVLAIMAAACFTTAGILLAVLCFILK